ncbi:MAG: hypothetical protein ACYTGC_08950 [Planctomycetota bacterium]
MQHFLPIGQRSTAWILFAILGVLPGCERDQVSSYSVPKEPAPAAAPAAQAGQMPDTLPPPRAVSGDLAWDLPEGWRTSPNTSSMRFATLGAGSDETTIEIAISRLGGAAGGVAANINRWRGQIGLPPLGDQELIASTESFEAQGAQVVMVDLQGPGEGPEAPRMLAAIIPSAGETWFIKVTATRAALDEHRAGFVELCRSTRFADGSTTAVPEPPTAGAPSVPASSPAAGGLPRWSTVPEGWAFDAEPKPLSVASMTISDAGGVASVTVTPLGGEQDLLANINRWRRQVGLGPLADLTEGAPAEIEIDGEPAQLVDASGPEQSTIAVVTKRGETTWFFKMSGPTALVDGQRDAFREFIRSIRFDH